MSKKEYLTAKGVAERWGIPYHVVLQARKAGKIKEELKPGRDIIFKVNKITKMMDKITKRWVASKQQKKGRPLDKSYHALLRQPLNLACYKLRNNMFGLPLSADYKVLQQEGFRPLDLRAYLQANGVDISDCRSYNYLKLRHKLDLLVRQLKTKGYRLKTTEDKVGFLEYFFELGVIGIMVRDKDGSKRYFIENKEGLERLIHFSESIGLNLLELWSYDEGCFRIGRFLAIMSCKDHAIATLSGNIKIWYRGKRSKRSEAIVLSVHEQVNEIRQRKGLSPIPPSKEDDSALH